MLTLLAPAVMLVAALVAWRSARPLQAVLSGSLATIVAVCIAAVLAPSTEPLSFVTVSLQLLTSFLAAIVAGFSSRYLRADRDIRGFAVRLALLIAALLTLIGADHLALIGAALVASSWVLSALIGHQRHWSEANRAARLARTTFLIGDVAMLATLAWLGFIADTTSFSEALASIGSAEPWAVQLAAAAVLVTAATRAGAPPFSNWLLGSMTAPTPVSALMHAGFVNGGGLLMIRFAPLMADAKVVLVLTILVGFAGVVWGSVIQLVRPDVKRALAGSTVAQMGFMLISCGLGAYGAALWHLIMHGMFKAWLFLGSGQAIGRPSERALSPLGMGTTLVIAGAALAAGLLLVTTGRFQPDALPMLLALASALTTAALLLGDSGWRRPLPAILVTLLGLIHLSGIALVERLVPSTTTMPGGSLVSLALLGLLLGFWIWQAWVQRDPRRLSPSLYTRLLNAGPRF